MAQPACRYLTGGSGTGADDAAAAAPGAAGPAEPVGLRAPGSQPPLPRVLLFPLLSSLPSLSPPFPARISSLHL